MAQIENWISRVCRVEVALAPILGHHFVGHVSVSLTFGSNADLSYDQP